MKFEKFLKGSGIHGSIIKRRNGDKWLVYNDVGMKVPAGVVNLLGDGTASDEVREMVEEIVTANPYDTAELTLAYLPADGKASDIIRIYSTGFSETGIHNADYSLLEESDVNFAVLDFADIKDSEFKGRYLLVLNPKGEIIGFIKSINKK